MSNLLDKRFIVIAGKGGVGRTTVSLVLGQMAASLGRRTLVCLCNAQPRYVDLLGDVVLSTTIRKISEMLHVVNLEPKACQKEYGMQHLNNRTLHALVFSSKTVTRFLDAVPGLSDWAMLGKATYHALETVNGQPKYDLVVFDSPATGHGLNILALPRAIVSAVPTGRMREEALARCELLEDPSLSEVIPVTLPEEMPVNETVEFVSSLAELGLFVERVVVNMVASDHMSPELKDLVQQAMKSETVPSWLLPASAALSRQEMQQESLERLLERIPAEQIILPGIAKDSMNEASLLSLVTALTSQLNGR